MADTEKQRLDLELVRQGHARSRAHAARMIKDKQVSVDGTPARKASQTVMINAPLSVSKVEQEWVGRGALKLLAALQHFHIDPTGMVGLDLGASTGGFSEVLIRKGADRVYAVDVGHDQLHPSLADDPHLISMEGVNARYLSTDDVPEPIDILVCDVSFISLKKLLPAGLKLCKAGAILIALIKPQFEVGKGNLGKGGVVRDRGLAQRTRDDIENWLVNEMKWRNLGTIESPIHGSDGNVEYLIGAVNDR